MGRDSPVGFLRALWPVTQVRVLRTFKNVCDAKSVLQHCEKLKVGNSLDFDEAVESFEVLYNAGLAKSTPAQLAKFRAVLVGDSKIQTALSKLKEWPETYQGVGNRR